MTSKRNLARYPQGQFAELAKNRISSLATATKPAETSAPTTIGGSATELAFWDAIKNSTSADHYRAYLEKYPNGEFVLLARRRLAPLEASEKEKTRADELGRQTQSFKGYLVRKSEKLSGSFILGSGDMHFVFDDASNVGKGSFSCKDLELARSDGEFIRELDSVLVSKKDRRISFQAESATAAHNAIDQMRRLCYPPSSYPVDPIRNAVVGVWKGDSPGGEKHYEFQFLPDGRLALYMKWNQYDGSSRGTWQLTGNTLTMEVDDWEKMQGTINQNQISGSWSRAGYKFTVTKQVEVSAQADSLTGTTWTGDSAGGDKHYEFRFQSGGNVVWNQKMASNVTYEGTWSQNGNAVTMNFRGLDDPVVLTIQGDQMSGSWYHGSYQLTVKRLQ